MNVIHRVDFSYVGSFQKGQLIETETPLEEVWDQVGRFGIPAISEALVAKANPPVPKPWAEWGGYATARFRQAVEFRSAVKAGSILTQPLPLYYSFLNLLRGSLAMNEQLRSSKGHGLKFHSHNDILSSQAEVSIGTFLDYSGAHKYSVSKGEKITLEDCFKAIPEMQDVYHMLTRARGGGRCATVRVDAKHSGALNMRFYSTADATVFESKWKSWYPALADKCTLSDPFTLSLVDPISPASYDAAADFLSEHLLMSLVKVDTAKWYAVAEADQGPNLPREMYYFVAAFILGSAVRYEPEQLMGMSGLESLEGWAIKRFIYVAERFFPQLILNRIYSSPLII